MAINNISDVARNAMVDPLAVLHDGGSLEIHPTPFGTALAIITYGNPAFGGSAAGTATANAIAATTVAVAGVAALARWKESGGAVIMEGTVGTSGQDVIVNNTNFGLGDDVTTNSASITAPAS